MTGVTRENGPHLAVRTHDTQQRQIVVDGFQREAAPVGGKTDSAHAPRELRGLAIRQCRQGHLLDLVGQFARVTLDGRHVLRRDVHAEQVRRHAHEHRRAVRVARRDGKPRVAHLGLRAEPAQDLFTHRGRHTKVIHRDQHRRPLLVAADRQRFRKQVLLDALVHVAPAAVPAEPHRIIRRDVHRGGADRPRHGLGRRIGGETCCRKQDQGAKRNQARSAVFHSGSPKAGWTVHAE